MADRNIAGQVSLGFAAFLPLNRSPLQARANFPRELRFNAESPTAFRVKRAHSRAVHGRCSFSQLAPFRDARRCLGEVPSAGETLLPRPTYQRRAGISGGSQNERGSCSASAVRMGAGGFTRTRSACKRRLKGTCGYVSRPQERGISCILPSSWRSTSACLYARKGCSVYRARICRPRLYRKYCYQAPCAPTGRWLVFCCSMCGFRGRTVGDIPTFPQTATAGGFDAALPAAEPATVIPNETNAPEMVLQAPGQYSICHSADARRFNPYVLVSTSRALTKSVGYKAVGRLLGLKKGKGVSGGGL
jgi:hypothetical protein